MSRVTEYIILDEGSTGDLEEAVNKMLGEGYQLFGGLVAVHVSDGEFWYTQTMVKIEETK